MRVTPRASAQAGTIADALSVVCPACGRRGCTQMIAPSGMTSAIRSFEQARLDPRHMRHRIPQRLQVRSRLHRLGRQMAAIGPRAGAAGEEAEHVAGDVMQALALRELLRDVGLVGLDRLEGVGDRAAPRRKARGRPRAGSRARDRPRGPASRRPRASGARAPQPWCLMPPLMATGRSGRACFRR